MIAVILVLNNGVPATSTGAAAMGGQAWWIAFIIVGIALSGAVLRGMQIGNIIDHASDRADKERTDVLRAVALTI
jgi:hypothetical protein